MTRIYTSKWSCSKPISYLASRRIFQKNADTDICGDSYISKTALEAILPANIIKHALLQCLSPVDDETATKYAKAILGSDESGQDPLPGKQAIKLFAILICCEAGLRLM